MNTSPTGANVTGSFRDFPLRVRLDSSNFDFSQARDDGWDLRFSGKDEMPLPFEIESWDQAGKQGIAWVKLDSIVGNDSGQLIRMYWGQGNADSESHPHVVFNSPNFGAVWHFQNLGAGSPPALKNASAAGDTAYAGDFPNGSSLVDTHLGKGVHQNGKQSELYTGKPFTNPGNLTLSLWFRTTTDSGGLLLGLEKAQASADSTLERDRQIWMDDSGIIRFGIAESISGGITEHMAASPAAYNDGNWHWAVGMVSSAGTALYLDGKQVALDPTGTVALNYTGYWRMGFSYPLSDWPGAPAAGGFRSGALPAGA